MASSTSTEKVFNLNVDVNDLTDSFRDMNKALKKAVVNTLNKVGRTINKEIATDIKYNFNIKAKSLKIGKTVRLRRADARREIPTFTISVLKKGRGLQLYGAKKNKAGVSVKVGRTRKTIKGAYIVRSRQNKQFVGRKSKKGGFIERTTKIGNRYRAAKSDWLYGPSIAGLYRSQKAQRTLRKVIVRDYQKELDLQFNNQFEKRR
ncbi:MAG: hypothetical protein GY928_25850 [Colwellia sp.]|nr:hypothetical protein [Colwellia sp.]